MSQGESKKSHMETITQAELATKYCVSRSLICDILSTGKRRPSRDLAEKLEEKSGVERMLWLYGTKTELISQIEKNLGRKINFQAGRPRTIRRRQKNA